MHALTVHVWALIGVLAAPPAPPPEPAHLAFERGRRLYETNTDLPGARAALDEALRLAPDYPDAYLYRDRSGDDFLPWQIIDGGMKTSFFRQELEKSQRAEWTLPASLR